MSGKKRGSAEIGERLDLEPKRVKYRDLESVFRSEAGVNLYNDRYGKNKQASDLAHSAEKEASRVTEEKSGKTGKDRCQVLATPAIISPDPNANIMISGGSVSDIAQTSFGDTTKRGFDSINIRSPREIKLHHNAEDVSSSAYCDPLNTDKYNDQLKSRDTSECGNTHGPAVEKDPMTVWKQMKQNGFMSTFQGGAPVPKPRSKKIKAETIKKKLDIARRDQVDRCLESAAPSGLLNALNPGIINNVRNSRQVRSKIEALLRSAKYEDKSAFKHSSSASMALENASSLSSEDSSNQAIVSALSLKAATVASEWLELLHQDIKGRLAALQRSKKRAQAVIETELPFLVSGEFSSYKENANNRTNFSAPGPADDLHKTRWSALFNQMNKSLNEEERRLESWLSQVNAMKLHCGRGLFDSTETSAMQQLATSGIDCRPQKWSDSQEGLEVKAAAAAFYSTCSSLQSSENLASF
ncbi:uncharacterized protein LOC108226702 isoform X1 [Daucus carota subsp. sativus]|uniref:uncharacterized protein LOC108226702 isoform X1 n=1 Tax=Daucus carota subsp. sativus TaxID=79200 RepID=UPI003083DBA9